MLKFISWQKFMILINCGPQITVIPGDVTKFKWDAKWLINIEKYCVPK